MGLRDQFGPLRLTIGDSDFTSLIADGFTWSNVDSGSGAGGFEALSAPLPRDVPTIQRGAHVLLTSGLKTVWEGRVSQPQRSLGHQTLLQCEGYKARFAETAGSMVFADRDLTRWAAPSYTHQISLVNGNWQLGTTQVAADPTSSTPALAQNITDSWVSPFKPDCEAWYDAGPQNLIAKVYYDLTVGSTANGTDANWISEIWLASDANATSTEGSGRLWSGSEVSGYFTPATAFRFAFAQWLYNATPAGTQGAQFSAYWHKLTAYGNHGLTGRGTDPVGFYPSDIFGWAVAQIPDLQPGVVQQTDASGYIVPHAAYYTPVALDAIAGDMARAQGWHWGVWESLGGLTGDPRPRVDFRPRPAPGAFTAFCRRSDCSTFDIREDLGQQYNECSLTFTDVSGVAGVTVVTADNPILDQAGIANRTLVLNGGTMTAATAALFAAEALALTNVQARVAGSISIISAIDFPSGPGAPWELKAGIDRLRVQDLPGSDAWGSQSDLAIQRVETSISSSGISTSVELGQGANLVETLQSRLTSSTALAGNGAG